jgi:hypothetical protein
MSNSPPKNPIPERITVADIKCQGRWGSFTATAEVERGETAMLAIAKRIEQLKALGNTILEIIHR